MSKKDDAVLATAIKKKLSDSEACNDNDFLARHSSKRNEYIPTGFPAIDYDLLDKGGLPLGKLIEIYGNPDSFKSLLLYRTLASALKHDKRNVAIIDTENRIDLDWIVKQGLDYTNGRIKIYQTNIAEDVFNIAIDCLASGEFSFIGLDSIGNVEAKQFMTGTRFIKDGKDKNAGYKADQMCVGARLTGSAAKRMAYEAGNHNTSLIAINQVRDNLNAYAANMDNTPGGRIWKFNRSLAIKLSAIGPIKIGDEVVGGIVKAEVKRSKYSPVGRVTTDKNHLNIFLEGGEVEESYKLFDEAIALGVIVKKGMWFVWRDIKWQGKEKALKAMNDPEIQTEVQADIDTAKKQ